MKKEIRIIFYILLALLVLLVGTLVIDFTFYLVNEFGSEAVTLFSAFGFMCCFVKLCCMLRGLDDNDSDNSESDN